MRKNKCGLKGKKGRRNNQGGRGRKKKGKGCLEIELPG